jgi:hypothetical protein
MNKIRIGLAASFLVASVASSFAAEPPRPKLIVQITVDQLRGDLPLRYQERFTDGGFRRFLREGIWYAAANQPHACTETVVGHTTLATATYPSRHGMVANSWIDGKTGKKVRNVETDQYPLLPIREGETLKGGAAPIEILTTTFSDELRIATGNHGRVFSVSGKERGAIPLAGHSGKAFWYSDKNGCFVTSTFYYDKYPAWVRSWCDGHPADHYRNSTWNLLQERPTYVYRDTSNQYLPGTPAAKNMAILEAMKFARTFPHFLADNSGFYQTLTLSPDFDRLTVSFAEELLRNEHLGHGSATDYLAVSLSATDYIGHWFSPSSLESEDNILRLDETLRELLSAIDKEVGLDNTLVVLSADHGAAEYPEFLEKQHVNTGRVIDETIFAAAQEAVKKKYGRTDLVKEFSTPYIYLNVPALGDIPASAVERTIAEAVSNVAGVAYAVPSTVSASDAQIDEQLMTRIRRNYRENRSGGVYVVQSAQWQIDEKAIPNVPQLLQHEAPWAYDTYVPIAFTGANLLPAMVYRSVSTVDVAATLAAYARTNVPSASVGTPLIEVFTAKSQ